MAIVIDNSDPNGQGMFSKAGRVTSARYIVFQKRVEILNNQKKHIKVSSLPMMASDYLLPQPSFKSLLEEDAEAEEKRKTAESPERNTEKSPFSRQLSREHIAKLKGKRGLGPPTGFYNPKYTFIEKTPSILFKYSKENSRPRSLDRSATSISLPVEEAESSRIIPEKQMKKIIGPIPMNFQTSRERFFKPANNPHEERFVYRDFPNSFSKMKRVPSYDMGRTSGRQLEPAERPLPDYDPNFDAVKKKQGLCGPYFFQQLGRKPQEYQSYSKNDEFFDVNKNNRLKFRRQKTVDFGKDLPRDWDTSFRGSKKGSTSRYSIGLHSQRTFEIQNIQNNFSGTSLNISRSDIPRK